MSDSDSDSDVCLRRTRSPICVNLRNLRSGPLPRAQLVIAALLFSVGVALADENARQLVAKPGLYEPLTEPPCSYCSTQHRKRMIQGHDRVVAWIRGAHNGGAIPLRHFLSAPRVINDTYGLFFYDPDGGYVAAYRKDYGYSFHGWRDGVMVARGPDGTLWSALSGVAFDGPQKGKRLERVPNVMTTWEHWLMLHPESTAYDLFDGETYRVTPLPREMSAEARQSMGEVDRRLPALAGVIGVEVGDATMAFPLDGLPERDCVSATVGGTPVAVFWYAPTHSAIAFESVLDGRALTFDADAISPESAPFKDRETGTRWTLAGRGVDGPLRGKELRWVNGIQCRWYAWAAEHPGTAIAARTPPPGPLRAVLLGADHVTDEELERLASAGHNAVVLPLEARDAEARRREDAAARRVLRSGLALHYWLEIGRSKELARAHPEWMASLQGHREWRRLFDDPPRPGDGEVIKAWPWVPVLYREAHDAHLARVERLLAGRPPAWGILLNDLQGAPSACGCGNTLCRWTTDYGPIRTATPMGADASARFVAAVEQLAPGTEVIPVWVTECEERDVASDGHCAGVGCFRGRCWKESTRQLTPVLEEARRLGVLLPFRELGRDEPAFEKPAGWVAHALGTLRSVPARHGASAVSPDRLIAVLQGWDVTDDEIEAQVGRAGEAGVTEWVVARERIDQSWEPRRHRIGSR